MHRQLKIPFGIVVSAQGGTALAPWVPWDQFTTSQSLAPAAEAKRKEVLDARAQAAATPSEADPNAGATGDASHAKVAPGIAPGELYARYIAPITPFTFRGVIWDQGESGTGISKGTYSEIYGLMLRGWRAAFQSELPFVFIQMPKGGGWNPHLATEDGTPIPLAALPDQPPAGKLNPVASEFLDAMPKLPLNYLAVSFDLVKNIHPWDKNDYGRRFAATALHEVYDKKDIPCYGPTVRRISRAEKGAIRIEFDHAEKGLKAVGASAVQGFVLAGSDNVFHWASATIDGSTVLLRCDTLAEPKTAGYAFTSPAPWANLFNGDGLPVQPFFKPVE